MNSTAPAKPTLLNALAAIVGPDNVITDPEAMRPYLVEPRELFQGVAAFIVRPGSTQEVSEIMRLAHAHRTAVVAQGGITGLVGGSIPDADGSGIVLSTGRMNRIRAVDPEGNTIIVEAGATLAAVQAAAEELDRLFPLSLGSEGTCTIGGNLGTNAGGTAVLAYGNTRDLTLGLEVVLADGRIWNGLRLLRKDNTGYDLKHLFIGAEGTLGIITAASLKLFPRPTEVQTALVAVASPEAALQLFVHIRTSLGPVLTGVELMSRIGIDMDLRHLANARDPFATPYPWYVLLECSAYYGAGLGESVQDALAEALGEGIAIDAVIARSVGEQRALWLLRHGIPEVQPREGASIKHDVSVPVAKVPAFIDAATRAVLAAAPGSRPVVFGHVGDGNVHFNVSQPVDADKNGFLARWKEINAVVHDVVQSFRGSISAEHGIGRLKRDLLPGVKDPVELALMREIKRTLDPLSILNPGVLL